MAASSILILAGVLHLGLLLLHGTYIAYAHGIRWGTGRRTAAINLSDLDRRFERTIINNTESMVAFVAVYAGGLALGAVTPTTIMAGQVYVLARLTFAALYLFNVPYIRTVVWLVSVGCIASVAVINLAQLAL